MTEPETTEPGEITRLLQGAEAGDGGALRQALALLHDRLRVIARQQLQHEGAGHTLETDALVHEAYLRLEGLERIEWRDRQHVLAMAARTMRLRPWRRREIQFQREPHGTMACRSGGAGSRKLPSSRTMPGSKSTKSASMPT